MTVANSEEIARIADAGIPMVMCPRTMAALGRPIPPYREARARGAVIGLGSDNAMTTRPDMLEEVGFLSRIIRSIAGDPSAVDAAELLASITRDAARAIQLDEVLGTVAPGKNASFVVMDMTTPNLRGSENPLASVVTRAVSSDIQAVIVDGRLEHGALKSR
jgi:cytosine/adenosine deaminase-related metal-dependent hydrolase